MVTSRSGSLNGRGRNNTLPTTLKIAVFAPIPSASVSRVTRVKRGFLSNWRKANLRSLITQGFHWINFCGSPRREPRREQRGSRQHERNGKQSTHVSHPTSFLRHDLQVGDDAVAIAPKANGAAGAVAEFVHHQRWLGSAVDEDFYLPLLDDNLGV